MAALQQQLRLFAGLLACLLLCLSSVRAAENDKKLFFPILAPRVGAAGPESFEYNGAVSSCLRQISTDFCEEDEGFDDDIYMGLWRTKVGCCAASHNSYNDEFVPVSMEDAGRCDYSFMLADFSSDDQPSLGGTFDATCFLSSTAQSCIEPWCDNMVLSVQGSIYDVDSGLVTDDPTEPTVQDCFGDFFTRTGAPAPGANNGTSPDAKRDARRAQRHAAQGKRLRTWSGQGANARKIHKKSASGSMVKTASATYSGYDSHRTLYEVYGIALLSGPMTVQSTKTGKAWHGWYESIFAMGYDSDPLPPGAGVGSHLVRGNEIRLKIYKDEESYTS